jgi:predicted nucleic acid-binding protein
METNRILVDTSLIIDFFRKKNKTKSKLFSLFQQERELYISTLTVYELLSGAESPQLQNDTIKILALFQPIDFGIPESQKAALLYQKLKKENQIVETIDILIAATALTHSMAIATLNQSHFERMDELTIFN